jgi:large subunit ribosomal protein L25
MEARLAAVTRKGRGKNEARRLRCAGQVPAVVYGGESREGLPVAVDPKALLRILHSESGVNTLIGLTVDGGEARKVLVKEFQLDPIHSGLLHVDFYRPALDKLITVTVPVTLRGEPLGVKQQGGLLDFVQRDVQVECMPTEIPEHLEIDVSELMIGDGVRLRDLLTDVEWTPVSEPGTLLVHVIAPKVEEEAAAEEETPEAAAAEGAAEGAPEGAEPEVIKKGKAQESKEQ